MLLIIALVSFNIELYIDKVDKYKLTMYLFKYISDPQELKSSYDVMLREMSKENSTTVLTYARIYDYQYGYKNTVSIGINLLFRVTDCEK